MRWPITSSAFTTRPHGSALQPFPKVIAIAVIHNRQRPEPALSPSIDPNQRRRLVRLHHPRCRCVPPRLLDISHRVHSVPNLPKRETHRVPRLRAAKAGCPASPSNPLAGCPASEFSDPGNAFNTETPSSPLRHQLRFSLPFTHPNSWLFHSHPSHLQPELSHLHLSLVLSS
jgi:hypothetical protein